MREERGDVAAAERLAFAEAEDERRGVLGDDDPIGCRARDDRDRVRAVHLRERRADRVEESWCAGAQRAIDEVRDDLGVGVGREPHAFCFERLAQRDVVLDDAVVHDRDVARRVRVRVGSLGRPCVAQRVWPMPVVPGKGRFASASSRCASLPTARTISMALPSCTARPAES